MSLLIPCLRFCQMHLRNCIIYDYSRSTSGPSGSFMTRILEWRWQATPPNHGQRWTWAYTLSVLLARYSAQRTGVRSARITRDTSGWCPYKKRGPGGLPLGSHQWWCQPRKSSPQSNLVASSSGGVWYKKLEAWQMLLQEHPDKWFWAGFPNQVSWEPTTSSLAWKIWFSEAWKFAYLRISSSDCGPPWHHGEGGRHVRRESSCL